MQRNHNSQQREKPHVFDEKNTVQQEPKKKQWWQTLALGKCTASYTIWNNKPFTRIDHVKSCNEAAQHMQMMKEHNDHIALSIYRPFILNGNYIEQPSFEASTLSTTEAEEILLEAERRYASKK